MRIVIESGLLYTVTAFISFVTFITGSNGVYVITDAVSVLLQIPRYKHHSSLIIANTYRRDLVQPHHDSSVKNHQPWGGTSLQH